MVAKRGRGAKAQAAKKAAAVAEAEQVPDVEMNESLEDNNGVEAEQEAAAVEDAAEETHEGGEEEQTEENNEGEDKPEEKKEDPVESGKVLVENLPSSYIFDYQDKLKELFSKHGEVTNVRRGPIVVTEQTTTPTLSAIVEFKNKDSLEKALSENGAVLDGSSISVAVESPADTAVLVGLPYEASTEYVKLLFSECGEVAQILEFSKTKYKILRVTFQSKEAVEKALKLDRELRINGFLVTVSKYQDDSELRQNNANKYDEFGKKIRIKHRQQPAPWLTEEMKLLLKDKLKARTKFKKNPTEENEEKYKAIRNKCNKMCRDARREFAGSDESDESGGEEGQAGGAGEAEDENNKRPHPQNQQNQNNQNRNQNQNSNSQPQRNANFRGGRGGVFNARGNFRGGRGRGGFPARGGAFPRGGFAGMNNYMPPAPYMQRPAPY